MLSPAMLIQIGQSRGQPASNQDLITKPFHSRFFSILRWCFGFWVVMVKQCGCMWFNDTQGDWTETHVVIHSISHSVALPGHMLATECKQTLLCFFVFVTIKTCLLKGISTDVKSGPCVSIFTVSASMTNGYKMLTAVTHGCDGCNVILVGNFDPQNATEWACFCHLQAQIVFLNVSDNNTERSLFAKSTVWETAGCCV